MNLEIMRINLYSASDYFKSIWGVLDKLIPVLIIMDIVKKEYSSRTFSAAEAMSHQQERSGAIYDSFQRTLARKPGSRKQNEEHV